MRIAVNTRFLLKDQMEGVGWYTWETIRRIVENYPQHEFHFLFDRPYDPSFITSENITPHILQPPARHPALWLAWFEYAVPQALRRIDADTFYSPDGFLSLRTDVPTLLIVHDLAFEHYPDHVPLLTRLFYRRFIPRYAKKASRIGSVSQSTATDLAEHYSISPDKIFLAHNGVRPVFQPMKKSQIEAFRTQHTRSKPYLFFVGAMHPRKNIARLIEAYSRFRSQIQEAPLLVLTGRMAWMTDDIRAAYEHCKYKRDILFTGHLNTQDLADYTAAAEMFCYVSLFEGFGVPVLEAMHAEVPLLCSDVSSIPEVAGPAAFYVNPHTVESIATGMVTLWNNPDLKYQLVEKGREQRTNFSWDQTAQNIGEELVKLGSKKP
jgi:glycosyltransferase involved in cell wall biosynthesis